MKIVFKGNNFVRMYVGELTYANLINFIQEKFPSLTSVTLSFQDQDGDSVMISSETDVQTMKELCQGKQIIKVDVSSEQVTGETAKNQEEKVEKTEKTEEKVETIEKECKAEEKKERRHRNSSKGCEWKKNHKRQQCRAMRMKKCHKFEKMISNIVEQRINSLIPCLVNQVHKCSVQGLKKIQTSSSVIHEGVMCSGCAQIPIGGIRYACLQCLKFNLCSECEEKIQHQHSLLKMRKPEVAKNCNKQGRRSSSSSSSSHQRKFHGWRRHHKWQGHHHKFENEDQRIGFICQKMSSKFGGAPQQYKQFVLDRSSKRFWEIMKEYCVENKIQCKRFRKDRGSSSSSSSSSSSKQKQQKCKEKKGRSKGKGCHKKSHSKHKHGPHRHHHGKASSSSSSSQQKGKNNGKRLERITNRMAEKFGGNSQQYKQYVSQRLDNRFWSIAKQYCADNNIQWKCWKKSSSNPERQRQIKLRKLALYFNKDEKQFEEVVNGNPNCNVKQLLKIIKEQGKIQFDAEDRKALHKMRNRFRREEEQVKSWIKTSKLIQKSDKKEESKEQAVKVEQTNASQKKSEQKESPKTEQNESFFRVTKPNAGENREKGRILIEMKEIFGDDKTKELFKFIEENFSLGQEKIIEKWIETEFQKNNN